jgi:hypothetical protein
VGLPLDRGTSASVLVLIPTRILLSNVFEFQPWIANLSEIHQAHAISAMSTFNGLVAEFPDIRGMQPSSSPPATPANTITSRLLPEPSRPAPAPGMLPESHPQRPSRRSRVSPLAIVCLDWRPSSCKLASPFNTSTVFTALLPQGLYSSASRSMTAESTTPQESSRRDSRDFATSRIFSYACPRSLLRTVPKAHLQ